MPSASRGKTGTTKSQSRRDLDAVMAYLNHLQCSGQFGAIDALLRALKVEAVSPTLLVCYLGSTLAARHRLHARRAFFVRVRKKLAKELGKERALKILEGLE
jgi:hypothetical protein